MALVKCRECGSDMSSVAKACPHCGASPRKKTSAFTWLVGGLMGLAFLPVIFNRTATEAPNVAASTQTSTVNFAETAKANATAACVSTIESKKAEYQKQMAAGQYWKAARAIGGCYNLLDDPGLKAMVGDAEVKAHVQVLKDVKKPATERLQALEMLTRDYPEQGKQFANLLPELQTRANASMKAEEKRRVQSEAARRKREGVSLGMTREDVLASSWGRPEKINRSHGSWGEHEQWVYPGHHNYLYFENGKLTSVQN